MQLAPRPQESRAPHGESARSARHELHAQSLLNSSTLKSQLSAPSKRTRRPASSASSAGAATGDCDVALGAATSAEALPALLSSRPAVRTRNARCLAATFRGVADRCRNNAPASLSPTTAASPASAAPSGGGHGVAGGSAPSDIAEERAGLSDLLTRARHARLLWQCGSCLLHPD